MDFCNKKYSEEEIRDYIERSSEEYIIGFESGIIWYHISMFQNLSEDFIRDFQDKLNWYWISAFQNLSEKFLIEFIEKIKFGHLNINKKIPKEVKERIINLKKMIDQ